MNPRLAADWASGSWLSGIAAGQSFLLLGLALCRQDLWWPGSGPWPGWIALNSFGLYGLLGGVVGLVFGTLWQLPRWVSASDRASATPQFDPIVHGMLLQGVVVWIYWALITQRQLAGLPLEAVERRSALVKPSILLLLLTVLAILAALYRRRRRPVSPRPSGQVSKRTLWVTAILVAATAASSWGLRLRAPSRTGDVTQPVLLVGLDAATLRILDPMFRAGELPTLARLKEEGLAGSLLTHGQAASPLVWTSIATGKRPADHGIQDFVVHRPGSYRPRPVQSGDLTTRTLWDLLGSRGFRVGLVDWLVSYPPQPVNGEIITRLQHARGSRSEPPELDSEIQRLLGPPPAKNAAVEDLAPAVIERAFDAAELLLDRATLEDSPPGLDFLAVFQSQTDETQHLRWRDYRPGDFRDPRWGDHSTTSERQEIIPRLYRQIDRRLGRLLERLPDETVTLVVSDHGALAESLPRTRIRLDHLLSELGYAELDPSGRALPAQSKIYALPQTPGQTQLAVNVNLQGRDRQGLVPEQAAPDLLQTLARQLEEIRLDDGARLFGEIAPGQRSDLVLGHSRSTRIPAGGDRRILLPDGREVPLADVVEVDRSITGDHDHQGILWMHGPGVRRGWIGPRLATTALQEIVWRTTNRSNLVDRLLPTLRFLGFVERASTLDLTPTVLHLLGLPKGRDMSGRVLREFLEPARPVDEIDTWELPSTTPAESPTDSEESGENDVETQEELDRLRALGYLD